MLEGYQCDRERAKENMLFVCVLILCRMINRDLLDKVILSKDFKGMRNIIY